jgi:arylsulfatase
MPDKPFFVYFAPGATHAPHHVPAEWSAKYKGKFDQGWDKLREETFARQKALGVIPPEAALTKRHPQIPAWEDISDEMKPILARQMEVYAGYLEHADYHVGRLVEALEDLEILGDTLIYYIIGDNGASPEGTLLGTINENITLNTLPETVDIIKSYMTPQFLLEHIDDFGTLNSYNHYAVGWAHAMDAPYQWTKQIASHWGGTRNGTIVYWPGGIHAKGEVRAQFHHVIDVAPTVLEAAGLPQPVMVNGVQQKPYEGISMAYSFDEARAAERHETQYFEMYVNRGIYHKGWTAVTRHSIPWGPSKLPAYDDDEWELYDTNTDWTQAHNLAKEMPEKLHELQRLFLIEAAKYNVLPLDDRRVERVNSDLAGRPVLIKGKSQLLFSGMGRLNENVVLNTKNKSYAVTAEVILPQGEVNGVIIAQGGAFGGWSLYTKYGHLKYCYNWLGLCRYYAESDPVLPAGLHQLRMEFAYDGGGLAKGGNVTLYLDGNPIGRGRVDQTEPMTFSVDETTDIGCEGGTVVAEDYTSKSSKFNGRINWIQLDQGADDHDHLISPEERLNLAMTRQ